MRHTVNTLLLITLLSCTRARVPSPETAPHFESLMTACANKDGWDDAAPPAHVFGNVYMVGTCGIVSLLVATPGGHFLIDGATEAAAPMIAENIRRLGFEPGDVKYLLATHEHFDHVGGLAKLKAITGAKFVTHVAAKQAMQSGVPHETDPQRGAIKPFMGLSADVLVGDGESLAIEDFSVRLVTTPGHSPGGASYTWQSCEGGTCYQIVYADSLSAVSADDYRFSDHPQYVATLRSSFSKIESLKACDL